MIPSPQESPLPYGILILGLALIVVVLVVLLRRKPKPSQRVAVHAGSAPREATAVFKLERSAGKGPATALQVPDDGEAYLVPLVDEAGTPGEPILIREQSIYIGRDESRAQVVFGDSSVSRLHARLIEESDGVFILHDEGSASGTFVNDERVDLKPRQLKSGDLIEFGRQKVVFRCPEGPRSEGATTDIDAGGTEALLSTGE